MTSTSLWWPGCIIARRRSFIFKRRLLEQLQHIRQDNDLFLDTLGAVLKNQRQIMADIQGLKDAVSRVATGVEGLKTESAALKSEVEIDGAKIKELTDQLANLPASGTSDPETDKAIDDIKAQLNGIADGLPAKVDTVVAAAANAADAANAASAATGDAGG